MSSRHLLIVDDDDGVRTFVAHVAMRVYPALTLDSVLDGAEAFRAFGQHPADLVITDMQMPIMSGLDLIRALRALPSAVPILMLSSDSMVQTAALATGATRFLAKPFAIAALRQTLRELLPP